MKKIVFMLLALMSVFFVVSCSGGTTDSDSTVLTVWIGGEPGTVNGYSELFAQFDEQNPDVEVEVVFIGDELTNPTLVPSLASGEGPDVFSYGTGPGQPATIISSGLVLSLNDYAEQYGWFDIIPEGVVNYTSSNGKLWSIGDEVETTMMFYNKEIFEEVGISVPTTEQEFFAALDALVQAGYNTPIGIGGADRWPISHWQSMLFGNFAGPEVIDNVMFGNGSWTEPEFVQAAEFLQNLSLNGYLGATPNAQGYAETMDSFWAGEYPMTYTGPWVISDALAKLGDDIENFSVFILPAMNAEGKVYPTEDIGRGWYINASSPNPDLAAEFLNFVHMTDSSRALLLETGTSWPVGPVSEVLETIDLPKLREEMAVLADEYRANGTVHAFLDTVQPARTTEATYNGLQGLISGDLTPLQFCEAIQAAWEMDKAEGLIMVEGGVDR